MHCIGCGGVLPSVHAPIGLYEYSPGVKPGCPVGFQVAELPEVLPDLNSPLTVPSEGAAVTQVPLSESRHRYHYPMMMSAATCVARTPSNTIATHVANTTICPIVVAPF